MPHWINRVFYGAALYYLLLGVTGIWWHSAWYFVSGLSPIGAEFIMDTFGGLMLALAASSFLGVLIPAGRLALIFVLCFANIFDLLVILRAIMAGTLGAGPGLLFITADVIWLGILGTVLAHYYRTQPSLR